MSGALIIVGLAIAAIGFLWPWIARLGLGRLPGDIFIQREGFTFYAPITTGILVSVVLSLVLWFFSR
jgi:hypothetical protein